MPDVLVRDVPKEAIDALDREAAELGLSRSESLRREWISRAAKPAGRQLSVADFRRSAQRTADFGHSKGIRGETLLEFFGHTADDTDFDIPPRDANVGRIPDFDL